MASKIYRLISDKPQHCEEVRIEIMQILIYARCVFRGVRATNYDEEFLCTALSTCWPINYACIDILT